VTFDSSDKEEQGFVVHKENGSKQIFRPFKKWLYYSDVAQNIGAILVHSVDINKSKYSIRQYTNSKKACAFQDVAGRPSTEDFKSRNIHFGTAELICDKTKWTLMTSIQQIVWAYHASGFNVCNILVDGVFECIRNNLEDMGITLNVASRNEHIPEVESYIRTIKERVRVIASSLPFKKYLPRLIAEMVYNVLFWLNSFPHNNRGHATISPRTLITGLAIDYHKHCKIAFGKYVQVHREVTICYDKEHQELLHCDQQEMNKVEITF